MSGLQSKDLQKLFNNFEGPATAMGRVNDISKARISKGRGRALHGRQIPARLWTD